MRFYIISPLSLTNHLQRMQNCAARLLTRTRRSEHITPLLFQLHWLPVCLRSHYKILFLTFKVLNETAPGYSSDLIKKYIPVRMLDLIPIQVWGYQEAIQQCAEIYPSEHQLPGCGTCCQTTLNSQQVKTHFVRFLKPIYLNWRIYNIKPVYYVWNIFDLYGLRMCFDSVLRVKRIRAISIG